MGAKNSATPAHFIQRESKLPRDVAEDDPILDEPRSQEGRATCP